MKKTTFPLLIALAFSTGLFSQEKPVNFAVTVSTDSILYGNYFEVKFTLENADAQDFEAPDFSENFTVVSGPNSSSSFSMINGETTQSLTITYYLEPKDIGTFYILPASVEASGQIVETQPFEVLVVPNPDGIKQELPSQQNGLFQFDWGGNPFDVFDFNFQPPNFPAPPSENLPEQTEPIGKPKKKLKTTRI